MKIIKDSFNSSLFIGEAEYQGFASVSLVARDTMFLEAEQIEELITDLELKLQEIKDKNK